MPWTGFSAGMEWDYRICCFDTDRWKWETFWDNTSNSIEDYRMSKKLSEIRRKMLLWEKISNCSYCYKQESIWVESKRIFENKKNNEVTERIVDLTNPNTWETLIYFTYLDIRFSNICNLACRMCSSESSTLRKELDIRVLWKDAPIWDTHKHHWAVDKFIKEENFLNNLKKIYIAWWEPLIDPDQYAFINMLIESWRSKNIYLKYNTNLTVLPNDFLEKLKQFRLTEMMVSCDGYGKVYEYIRIWWKWQIFVKNLLNLGNHIGFDRIMINIVAQRDNVSNIPKLYIFLRKIGIKKFNIIILIYSKFLAISNIELEKRSKILNIYYYYIKKYSQKYPSIEEDFSEIISILKHEKPSEFYISEYYRTNNIIDNYIQEKIN